MIASTDPLQFDEPTSVAIGEHLQKCVHTKVHDKLGHIIVAAQRSNKKMLHINLWEKMWENKNKYPPETSSSRILVGGSDMPIYSQYLIDFQQ